MENLFFIIFLIGSSLIGYFIKRAAEKKQTDEGQEPEAADVYEDFTAQLEKIFPSKSSHSPYRPSPKQDPVQNPLPSGREKIKGSSRIEQKQAKIKRSTKDRLDSTDTKLQSPKPPVGGEDYPYLLAGQDHQIIKLLTNNLQQAILLKEILDKPKALQKNNPWEI
jgi:hypothetical protein